MTSSSSARVPLAACWQTVCPKILLPACCCSKRAAATDTAPAHAATWAAFVEDQWPSLDDSGLAAFLQRARAAHDDARLGRCLDLLESAAAAIRAMDSGDIDASASAFLHLAILAAGGWIAGRFLRLQTDTPSRLRMRAAAEYWLDHCTERAALCHAEVLKDRRRLMAIDAIRRAV